METHCRVGAEHSDKSSSPLKAILLSITLTFSVQAAAQEVVMSAEYSKKISDAQKIIRTDGFGSSISDSTGETTFTNIDIDVPGNSKLPVQFGRRLTISERFLPEELGGLGNWDIDVPYIEGTFSNYYGWSVSSVAANRYKRCSITSPPINEGGIFTSEEIWHGHHLHIPGMTDETLIADAPGNVDPTGGVYPWITRSNGRLGCVPMKNGYPGEGFVLLTTEGVKYYFDYAVERVAPALLKGPKSIQGYRMARKRVFLLATRIEDRFGNHVDYQYNNGILSNITANDGRQINLQYSSNLVTATTNGRTWQYTISSGHLVAVQNPDASKWQYTPFGSLQQRPTLPSDILQPEYFDPDLMCSGGLDQAPDGPSTFQVTHPSGATAKFDFEETRFYRNKVRYLCFVDFFDHQVVVSGGAVPFVAQAIDWNHVQELVNEGQSIDQAISNSYVNYDAQMPIEEYVDVAGFARIGISNYYDVYSLKKLGVSGPGLIAHNTNYEYLVEEYPYCDQFSSITGEVSGVTCAAPPCSENECVDGVGRWTRIIQPSGTVVEKRFGVLYGKNEGVLLEERIATTGTTPLKHVAYQYMDDATAAAQLFKPDMGQSLTGDPMLSKVRPLVLTTITQDGANFNARYYEFDAFARPKHADRWSAGMSTNYSRTDVTEYHDNLNKWVLGQISKVTNANTGIVPAQVVYDSATALPVLQRGPGRTDLPGKTTTTFTYNANGTLATIKDGNNNQTTFSDWHRGTPRSTLFADGSTKAATVDDNGWITSATDQTDSKTCYGYDAMGRINLITYPSEGQPDTCDATAWLQTHVEFRPMTVGEWRPPGVEAGQWRQYTYRGNYQKIVYLDAMWRPVLTHEYDASNTVATLRSSSTAYDSAGRVMFQSYPSSDLIPAATGAWTEYDALSRVIKQKQNSEHGELLTKTDYLAGFQVRVTNPRDLPTTTSYQAFDQPSYDAPVLVVSPQNTTTEIARDVFGKPVEMIKR
jgi:hypothetical protein